MTNFIFELIKAILITGFVGNLIASYFQERAFLNQIKIKRAEDEVKIITDIAIGIVQLSSKRRYISMKLIENLMSCNDLNNDTTNRLRKEYRDVVKEWNLELPIFYIKLSNINLYQISVKLEKNVHDSFREVHRGISSYIEQGDRNNILSLEDKNCYIYSQTKILSNKLIEEANRRKDSILNDNTEELSRHNLNKTPVWKLIIAIFYTNPKRLRVPRSS